MQRMNLHLDYDLLFLELTCVVVISRVSFKESQLVTLFLKFVENLESDVNSMKKSPCLAS
jgi:hypothetical protein